MFPGQGSQYIGMGKEFYEQIPICKEVYDLASEVTGLDIPALCFEENEKLNITEYTQICMLATEAAIYMALEQNGYQPDVTAGLSLGEYGALIASGVMTAEEAFELVRKRGIFMQEAVPAGGAMAAVLGLDAAAIEQICRETAEQTGSEVSIANYNCPGQIVISGQEEAVHLAGETCKASGAKRVVPLKVSPVGVAEGTQDKSQVLRRCDRVISAVGRRGGPRRQALCIGIAHERFCPVGHVGKRCAPGRALGLLGLPQQPDQHGNRLVPAGGPVQIKVRLSAGIFPNALEQPQFIQRLCRLRGFICGGERGGRK